MIALGFPSLLFILVGAMDWLLGKFELFNELLHDVLIRNFGYKSLLFYHLGLFKRFLFFFFTAGVIH